MLTYFSIKRTFNLLQVTLHVECDAGRAGVLVRYDRVIIANTDLCPGDAQVVQTPAGAEAWLSQEIGEHGTRVETWEAFAKARARTVTAYAA